MKNKKGFEIQFNWLFVMVAGAAILIFFAAVLIKQKNFAESSSDSDTIRTMSALIAGASSSAESSRPNEMPNLDIQLECNKITSGKSSRIFEKLVLFSPSRIKDDQIITQSISFNVPYRTTNLLMASSPKIRYIIIGEENPARYAVNLLPPNINKEQYCQSCDENYDPAFIRNLNNYKVRFVVFDGDMPVIPMSLRPMPDNDVTAVQIIGDTKNGLVEFYEKNSDAWESLGKSSFIGSSILGAVYSDSLANYECSMQNVFSRLSLVSQIYLARTKSLVASGDDEKQKTCNGIYSGSQAIISKIIGASQNFNDVSTNIIADSADELKIKNKRAQLESCVMVY